MMRLAEPGWLAVLALTPLPWWAARSRPRLLWPTLAGFAKGPRGASRWRFVGPLSRCAAIACLAVALARPQSVGDTVRVAGKGVAIVVALDRSSSMTAEDFAAGPGGEPGSATTSRLAAAKATFGRFVAGRGDDLIGLVAFANFPDVICPPTLDHRRLLEAVRTVRPAKADDDGTNIGHAIVKGIEALRAVSPRKKVLILLTDGVDSPAVAKPTPPEVAAALARELGVTLHTIAVGRPGGVVHRVEPRSKLPIASEVGGPDLALLRRLADIGGGRAFVADDSHALDDVFGAIDALETSPVQGTVRIRYREEYAPWAAAAMALLVLDRLATAGRLRRMP
ncbi:MAG TPA: VWA domain-containing protein [Isosphaeraceae bacterium]|jgi:Ca-activated chloride channel family protein|nr:VWA domain-containing protein [Isosphaeraceae bacterium]